MKKETITGLYKAPGKKAEARVIPNTLEALQELVGGYIEAVSVPIGSGCVFICNEEGKILGMPLNRSVRMEGQIVDIIAGTFFICDCSGSNFGSLSQEQQQKYLRMFKYPERFLKINGEIAALKYNPNEKGKDR